MLRNPLKKNRRCYAQNAKQAEQKNQRPIGIFSNMYDPYVCKKNQRAEFCAVFMHNRGTGYNVKKNNVESEYRNPKI